jgi:ABC-type lipoprotein release transport system permease subunit
VILKNLQRRKIRTLLTIFGISIGVAAIIVLGTMADGLEAGYGSIIKGSKADLILSQPDAFDISYSSVEEVVIQELQKLPEVAEVSGMIQGFASVEDEPFFFVFGYPKDSFILGRFKIIEGVSLDSREAQHAHGRPILLGSAAADVLNKTVGDSLLVTGSIYRIVGIYESGDAFEDSGAILNLSDAQELLGKPRQVSIVYISLKDPENQARLTKRIERSYSNLELSGVQEFSDNQVFADILRAYVWVIGGMAILIGGVGMMNAQLMAVMERTREIGVLRATGWSRSRVLFMILGETILVCLAGGVVGVGIGYLILLGIAQLTVILGSGTTTIQTGLLLQALSIVFVLGLFGGLYPAWRASRMLPVEALRYEGGSSGKSHRLPLGGMAVQGLWQRSGRTLLTLSVIGISVGAIMALETMLNGFISSFGEMMTGSQVEIMVRQNNITDTELSVIDERIGDQIAALPEVESISGWLFSAVMLPETGSFFIIQGFSPNEIGIQRFKIVEGEPLASNHQIILGRLMADTMKISAGDTIDLSGTRFRVVGIYETGVGWEETGGVVTLRDAQTFTGKPHKVSMYGVKMRDPAQAEAVVELINRKFPDMYATLTGEFVQQMPDMKTMDVMINGISFLAILVGGIGVLNTMLMSVFERTREIGALRALGWRRRSILGLILRESLILGALGGLTGILIAFSIAQLLQITPLIGDLLSPQWDFQVFSRTIVSALLLGILGGLYPAYRATRLQPVEALRYE